MELKIQFIITGWHYNQPTLINTLKSLIETNPDQIQVFFACHNEPPKFVKENFKHGIFPNLGLEWGAYDQAIEHLDISDNTICFFLQDDLIIKDLEFINVCIDKLNSGVKFIGNGTNYPNMFDPNGSNSIGVFKDLVKEENKHLFDIPLNIKTIRGSFICTLYKYLKNSNGFESMLHIDTPLTPKKTTEGKYEIPGLGGIGGFGNTQLSLFAYKINKLYGPFSIDYLSERYLDSDFIYECARGNIDPNNPIT